jgi:hypothetical protein
MARPAPRHAASNRRFARAASDRRETAMGYIIAIVILFILVQLAQTLIGSIISLIALLALVAAGLIAFGHWMLFGCARFQYRCHYEGLDFGTLYVVSAIVIAALMAWASRDELSGRNRRPEDRDRT